MVIAMIKAWDFQISFRVSCDAFAFLPIFVGRYACFHIGVIIRLVDPNYFTGASVQIGELRNHVVVIDIAAKGHREQNFFDGQSSVTPGHAFCLPFIDWIV